MGEKKARGVRVRRVQEPRHSHLPPVRSAPLLAASEATSPRTASSSSAPVTSAAAAALRGAQKKEENTRRIVLLGKTGSGKSSLANTLFGEKDTFEVTCSVNSVTKFCQSETRTINGRIIQLIDTPGFFDTNVNSDELKSVLFSCITLCVPGPHAFLLVLTVGKFTEQEEKVVDLMINENFGEEALKYTTVVFTHGDQLDEGVKIEDWLKENESLKKLVDKCGGRCHVIDNKYWNDCQKDLCRNNQYQIKQLLKKIDQTVRENGGGYYTNKMLQRMQEKIEEKKAEIKQSSPNISEESLNEKAKESVYNLQKNKMKGITGGALLGALLGGVTGIVLAECFGASYEVTGGGGVAVGAAVGGAVGGAVVSEN